MRAITILVATLIILTLAPSCQYVEPPDYDAQIVAAYENGAMAGCLRTFVNLSGQDIPPAARYDVLVLCEEMVKQAVIIGMRSPVPRLDVTPDVAPEPVRPRPPGSEL